MNKALQLKLEKIDRNSRFEECEFEDLSKGKRGDYFGKRRRKEMCELERLGKLNAF